MSETPTTVEDAAGHRSRRGREAEWGRRFAALTMGWLAAETERAWATNGNVRRYSGAARLVSRSISHCRKETISSTREWLRPRAVAAGRGS
jgi:hypothetical protein